MLRIMVVDDDTDTLRYSRAILSSQGHEVYTSSDTNEALDTIKNHHFDLVVCDIVMPHQMNGFDFVKSVRQIQKFKIPVLMLSGKSTREDVIRALQVGATDYMCKPLDRDVFLAKVGTLIKSHDTKLPEVRFADAHTAIQAEIQVTAMITSITEMGLKLITNTSLEKNAKIKVQSALFNQIGIEPPYLRVVHSEYENNHFLIYVSFIGLTEQNMRLIRKWVAFRAIEMRRSNA